MAPLTVSSVNSKKKHWLLVALFVSALIGLVLAGPIYLDYKASQVRSHATRIPAQVVTLKDTGDRFNRKPVVYVGVEFTPPGAKQPIQAEVKDAISVVHLPRFQPGNKIEIFINPENPTEIALEEEL